MICGLKWKSCNCPWFNYEAVEADRVNHQGDVLNHMRVPEIPAPPLGRAPRIRRPPPPPQNYDDEMARRRQQERSDENFARLLQLASIDDEADDLHQGGIGNAHGIGNGARHFTNQNYIRTAQSILTSNFDQASAAANYVMGMRQARGYPPRPPPGPPRPPPARRPAPGPLQASPVRYPPPPAPGNWPGQGQVSPLPLLRRHSMRDEGLNTAPPPESVLPRRSRTGFDNQRDRNASPERSSEESERLSVLAGLAGTGRYANRVGAWRAFVEPVAPSEGVLSML